MEMELKVDSGSMAKLLKFLTGGFNGGTDVDKPLELSLKRLAEQEWNQVSSYSMQSFPVRHWAGCYVLRVCCCMLWMGNTLQGARCTHIQDTIHRVSPYTLSLHVHQLCVWRPLQDVLLGLGCTGW